MECDSAESSIINISETAAPKLPLSIYRVKYISGVESLQHILICFWVIQATKNNLSGFFFHIFYILISLSSPLREESLTGWDRASVEVCQETRTILSSWTRDPASPHQPWKHSIHGPRLWVSSFSCLYWELHVPLRRNWNNFVDALSFNLGWTSGINFHICLFEILLGLISLYSYKRNKFAKIDFSVQIHPHISLINRAVKCSCYRLKPPDAPWHQWSLQLSDNMTKYRPSRPLPLPVMIHLSLSASTSLKCLITPRHPPLPPSILSDGSYWGQGRGWEGKGDERRVDSSSRTDFSSTFLL